MLLTAFTLYGISEPRRTRIATLDHTVYCSLSAIPNHVSYLRQFDDPSGSQYNGDTSLVVPAKSAVRF